MAIIELHRTRGVSGPARATIHKSGCLYLSASLVAQAGWHNVRMVEIDYDDTTRAFTLRPTTVRTSRAMRLHAPAKSGPTSSSRTVFNTMLADLSGVRTSGAVSLQFTARCENGAVVIDTQPVARAAD